MNGRLITVCALTLSACGGSSTRLAGPDVGAIGSLDASAGQPGLDASAQPPGEPDAATPVADAAVETRQALRDRSLFANSSFEEVGDNGPAGWQCAYFGTGKPPDHPCVQRQGDVVDGKRLLELEPGVAAWAKALTPPPARHVRFDLFARAQEEIGPGSFYLIEKSGQDVVRTLSGRTSAPAQGNWSFFESYSAPLDGSDQLTMVLYNTLDVPMQVDDLVAVEIAEPIVVAGHLLFAEGYDAVGCTAGAEEAVLWVPLPLMHGVQVPKRSQPEPTFALHAPWR